MKRKKPYRVLDSALIAHHSSLFFRVVDANLNRAREGLRVCEEVARLVLEAPQLTWRCQRLRYELHKVSQPFLPMQLLQARDARRDIGRPSRKKGIATHSGYRDLTLANAKRVQEALRVVEEFTRLRSAPSSLAFSRLRFRVYNLEQDILRKLQAVLHR